MDYNFGTLDEITKFDFRNIDRPNLYNNKIIFQILELAVFVILE